MSFPPRLYKYFFGGNASSPDMILQTGPVQFYVDRVTLEEHSPIFRAMFLRAEAAGADFTKVPVVRIDDDEQDMYLTLTALYDPPETTKSFRLVSAMFRLGKKYEIDELYDDAYNRLEHDFPRTLVEYRELHGQTPRGVCAKTYITPYAAVGFDVVNFARAHGLNKILPAAFYICLTVHLRSHDVQHAISHGLLRENNTLAELSSADKDLCLSVLRDLIDHQRRHPFQYFYDVVERGLPQSCTSPATCIVAVASFLEFESCPSPAVITLAGLDAHRQGLCPSCAKRARGLHSLGQGTVWNLLPSFFGLGPWGALENLQ
ncbi:hypothetical protein B0H11DRAFT_2191943 [Mycena galericulata]|nr:hypothetical protein B0H11DRAFT_2191943 [Mycena galericulata]